MKKLKIFASMLMAMCLTISVFGPLNIFAVTKNAAEVTNVALGKDVSFQNRDFTPATNVLVYDDDSAEAEKLVTDGSFDPNNHVVYMPQKGWCVIDLGQTYTLSHLVTSFWHSWDFDDVVIEASEDAAFTAPITLFNNDADNSVGRGIGRSGAYQDVSGAGQTISFSPLDARYIRVTNDGKEGRSGVFDNCSIFTEIEVYAFTGENPPPVADTPSGTYASIDFIEFSAADDAEIYYTVDGSYPTQKSLYYTEPIDVQTLGNAFRIRAVAVRNGVTSPVSNYEYYVGGSGTNVAAGKLASFDPLYNVAREDLQFVGFDASADNVSFINDGAFNPTNALRLAEQNRENAVGWAVVDFGQVYAIDELQISFWNTWGFYDVVIQLSESADFTEGVTTVYNSNADGSLIGTAGSDPVWAGADISGAKTLSLAEPVNARYIRVTNDTKNIQGNPAFHYVSVFTEIQAYSGGENVALNKPASTMRFGEGKRFIGLNASADNPALATDGSFDPNSSALLAADLERNYAVGWAVVDFGQSYTIDRLVLSFWHEWNFYDVVIQLSESADFTEGVTTVYNGNEDGSLIGTAGTDGVWKNVPNTGTELKLDVPVSARYMRITNNTKENAGNTLFSNVSAFTEIQAYSGDENVALNKVPSLELISVSSSEGEETVLHAIGFNGSTGGAELITDGSYAPDGAAGSVVQLVDQNDQNAVGWAILDLGQIYAIDSVNLSFWHEWNFYDVVVQLSESADFTKGVTTLFNGNEDGSIIGVAGEDGVWKNIRDTGTTLTLDAPVNARYIRVTNNTKNDSGDVAFQYMSVFTEIQVFSAAAQLPPLQEIVADAELPEDFSVGNSTPLEAVLERLPGALEIVDTAGGSYTVHGTWTCEGYAASTPGDYTFVFVPTDMPANVSDANGILCVKVTVAPAADKTALGNMLDEISQMDSALYTTDSWNDLATAVQAAEGIMNDATATQAQVDEALASLNDLVKNLVLRGDKSGLAETIESVGDYSEEQYTAVSWDAVEQALAQAKLVQEDIDATQGAIDQAIQAIEEALAGLQLKGNTAPLAQRIEQLKDTQNQNYTPGSWAAFEDALENARAVAAAADPSQQEVDAALEALNSAYAALTEIADKSDLNALIEDAEAYVGSDYTAASFETFESALKAARAVAENDDATAEQVAEAISALQSAIAQLAKLGDRTALEAKIRECEAISGGLYTAESYSVLVEALAKANNLLGKTEILESEVSAAIDELESAVEALVPLAMDREQLQAAIDRAQSIQAGDYTEESYAVFTAALENARSVLASESATQAVIDDAAERLNRAIDNLDVSKVSLKAILNRAEQVERDRYSAESLAALDEAIADAKAVFDSPNATLEQVSGAEENLRLAIEGLEENKTSPWPIVLICVGAVAILAAAGLFVYFKKRSKHE